MRLIQTVNFAITDRCNRACPDCCCGMPLITDRWDATWEYLAGVAECVRGIGRIILTGGEPSLHPRFADWVAPLKALFVGTRFCIETNGFAFQTRPELFEAFDTIWVSRYDSPAFDNPNQDDVARMIEYFKGKTTEVLVRRVEHVSRSRRGTTACFRGTGEWVSIYKGRVYPCCMGWGIDGAQSVAVTKSWMEEVKKIPLPCSTCLFAG